MADNGCPLDIIGLHPKQEPETIIIDEEGDLYVRLENRTMLKVSRKILCLSSPVFNTMLRQDSRWSIDRVVAPDGSPIIEFPDDDAEAMTLYANIVHLQNHKLPRCVGFDALYPLAVLCDKYDCEIATRPWPSIWIKEWWHGNQPHLGRLIFLAFVFRDRNLFQTSTASMIKMMKLVNGTLKTDKHEELPEVLPVQIRDEIARLREERIFEILVSCHQMINRLKTKVNVCRVTIRGDTLGAREFCDSLHLGILIRKFPNLHNPRKESKAYRGTVIALYDEVINMNHLPSCGDSNPHDLCFISSRLWDYPFSKGVAGVKLERKASDPLEDPTDPCL